MDIGTKIKNARLAKGLTQEQLGEIIGVQKSAVAKYESGKVVNIKRSTLQKLAAALDLRGSDLIIESDPIQTADTLSKVLKNDQLMDLVEKFVDLPEPKQKIVIDLVNSLHDFT